MGEWKSGLFGCLGNTYLSLVAYVAPCYVAGKNAQEIGYSCTTLGLIYFLPFVGCYYNALMRSRIRDQHDIEESRLHGCCVHTFCSYCALIQDAQELTWWKADIAESRDQAKSSKAGRTSSKAVTNPPRSQRVSRK